ncbi:MAG: arylesterase [Nitrospirales bacterium]|nr:MAG: arylesterase [Nitrospirales bacterium]
MGYQSPTAEVPYYHATPYGELLQAWLGEKGRVLIRGVNGEMTSEMVRRFSWDVLQSQPDIVIILGGTNDLGAGVESEAIFTNLVTLYEQAKTASIAPVAITVPSLRGARHHDDQDFLSTQIECRMELNQWLMNYCHASNMPCIDLFTKTSEPENRWLASEYSNDGLHLSSKGYQLLAQLLWNHLWAKQYCKSSET